MEKRSDRKEKRAAVTALYVQANTPTPAHVVKCTVRSPFSLFHEVIQEGSMPRRNPPRPRLDTPTRQFPFHQPNVDRSVATADRSAGWDVVVACLLRRWELEEEIFRGVPVHGQV